MLDFLDALCQVLATHDGEEIRRRLRHPLARLLPGAVRAEALAITRGAGGGHLPPTRTYHFYYQTLQLLASVNEDDPPDALCAAPPLDPVLQPFVASVRRLG